MPEAPDLEVVKDFLNERVAGLTIESARITRPGIVRSLTGDLTKDVSGLTVQVAERRGKFLLVRLSERRIIFINPMLAGAIQYCRASERVAKRTCLVLSFDNGRELRYLDDKRMGMVYFVTDDRMDEVPRLGEQGSDVLDEIPFEEFVDRLKPFHGEIKGILTRGRFISGIGNAYADEILFDARIYPFKRRKALAQDELRRLHESCRTVTEAAVALLRARMGERIHVKIRDFLKVHNKGGEPCPRCGATVSQITANRRITSYCRGCQPGMLIRN